MKKYGIFAVLAGLVLTACGSTNSDPLKDYSDVKGVPAGTQPSTKIEYVYVDREQRVEVPVDRPVYYPEEVKQEFAQAQVYQINFPNNIKFTEGSETSFEFTVRVLQGKVKFDVEPSDMPAGAVIAAVSKDVNTATYKFTWTPRLGIIPTDSTEIEGLFKVSLSNLQYVSTTASENEAVKTLFETISKTKEVPYVVRRTQEIPTLTVIGLQGNRAEGEEHRFTVEVEAPGTYVGFEPNLNVFNDLSISPITPRGVENNGALYIRVDERNPTPVKIGEEKWRFSFVFDTKNNIMLKQLNQNGVEVAGATQFLVRVSFQAITPFGSSSDKKMLNFAVTYKPAETVTNPTGR